MPGIRRPNTTRCRRASASEALQFEATDFTEHDRGSKPNSRLSPKRHGGLPIRTPRPNRLARAATLTARRSPGRDHAADRDHAMRSRCRSPSPSLSNVPPLSSGRIRKPRRSRWRRASPWYFTTGEREPAVGHNEARPSASTACWAASLPPAIHPAIPKAALQKSEKRYRQFLTETCCHAAQHDRPDPCSNQSTTAAPRQSAPIVPRNRLLRARKRAPRVLGRLQTLPRVLPMAPVLRRQVRRKQ
jgi:hypothetical protein